MSTVELQQRLKDSWMYKEGRDFTSTQVQSFFSGHISKTRVSQILTDMVSNGSLIKATSTGGPAKWRSSHTINWFIRQYPPTSTTTEYTPKYC